MRRMTIWMAGLCAGLAVLGARASDLEVSVVDKEGKPVADAVVVLLPSAGGLPREALPAQITISQEKMRFIPAVSLVRVGANALFVNNDPWEHHVRASAAGLHDFTSAPAGGFELRLDGKDEGKPAKSATARFDKAGGVLLGCHLHASMRGHVYVSDSPWAQLTSADGLARFADAPAGPAQVRVWHADQILDLALIPATLGATPAKATAQLSVVPRRRRI